MWRRSTRTDHDAGIISREDEKASALVTTSRCGRHRSESMAPHSPLARISAARIAFLASLVGCSGLLVLTEATPSPCASVACGDGKQCCPTQNDATCVAGGTCTTTGLTCTSAATCASGQVCCVRQVVNGGGAAGPGGGGPGGGGPGGGRFEGGAPPGSGGGPPPGGDGGGGLRPGGDGGFAGGPPGANGGGPGGGMNRQRDGGASGAQLESYCASTCAVEAEAEADAARLAGPRASQLCASDDECAGGTCTTDGRLDDLRVCQPKDGG